MQLSMPRPVVLTLKKDLSRALRQGHPWVYRDALAERRGLAAGALVTIADRRGRELAHGYFDPEGPIADGRIRWTGDPELGARAARNLAFTM